MPSRPEIVRCSPTVPCTYRELFDAVEDIIYIRDLAPEAPRIYWPNVGYGRKACFTTRPVTSALVHV